MITNIRQSTGHGIRPICTALRVPRSSYYHAAELSPTQRSDEQIGDMIEAIFKRHRRRYGYRRIWDELSDQEVVCAADRVRRIMKERGLKAIQPKSYVPRTSDGRADKPSENLLINQSLPEKPDQVWAGDITHIPISTGWLYLAVVIDLCTRKIVGWSLADHMRGQLVNDALSQALEKQRPHPGLIFHSDRGSQYGSGGYRHLLRNAGIRQSMSARANPYHNAWTESFMGTIKNEMLQNGCFINRQDALMEIFDYIESYYNIHRKHSSLNYRTPVQFEAQILSQN
jgi:transposase InsO family protein